MKYTFLLFFLILSNLSVFSSGAGQLPGDSSAIVLNRMIVRLYNKSNNEAIYALGSTSYQQLESAASLAKLMNGYLKKTGSIITDSLLYTCGKVSCFLWVGEKSNLRVKWFMSDPDHFDDYQIDDLIVQPSIGQRVTTDNPLFSPMDRIVQQNAQLYLQNPNTKALTIGILKNGKSSVYNYGETGKGNSMLPDTATRYLTGSIAKTFVSLMIAQAVIDGKVKLTADIRTYLPGTYPNLQFKGTAIRVVNLLNHTSGLPDSYPYPAGYNNWTTEQKYIYFESYTADSLANALHVIKPEFLPGSRYAYNSNVFHILILILEKVYNKPYEQILRPYLEKKFGMKHTGVTLRSDEAALLTTGYNATGNPLPKRTAMRAFRGGPSLFTTAADMLLYLQANLSEKNQAIKLTHKVTYRKDATESLGLAWMVTQSCSGEKRIYHSGKAGSGFLMFLTFYPERQEGIVIMVNETISQGRISALEQLLHQQLNEQSR
ncbi:MAG TPA: serine hydrolase domain-containing protein [Paludibacter sp.]|nr:serine hydrolase domain-containing protein [Paludibacter sp.]